MVNMLSRKRPNNVSLCCYPQLKRDVRTLSYTLKKNPDMGLCRVVAACTFRQWALSHLEQLFGNGQLLTYPEDHLKHLSSRTTHT